MTRIIRHKFKAIPTTHDGIRFASKKEANRYLELKRLQESGEIVYFHLQPRFDLPGKVKYYADFLIFWEDGTATYEDVKGFKTPEYKIKKKITEAKYPIQIKEI